MTVVPWLKAYRPALLRSDGIAGITTAAVVVPQALAYATIAGLPLEHGLYCALVPMAMYALLGTSRPLSVSTTSTISLLTAAAIATAPSGANPAEVASLVAIEAGAVLLLAGAFGLGFVSDFISRPVLAGFKIGMGLTIAASQLGKILGVEVEGRTFFPKVWSALENFDQRNGWTLGLALASLVALLALKRIAPRIPGPLIVLAAGMALIATTGLEARGVATSPPVPGGLPIPWVPDLEVASAVLPAALGVALMAFVESIAAGRAFRHPDDPVVEPSRELIALGAANVAGGFFRSYGSGGGLSQTAVNDQAGARSQAAGLVTAAMTALVLLFLSSLVRYIPEASLGAIVLVAAIGLIDIPGLRSIGRVRPDDMVFGTIGAIGVLVLGTLPGLLLGVVVSLISLFRHLNHPPVRVLGWDPGDARYRDVAREPGAETVPRLLIVRIEGPLYFGNAQRVNDRIAHLIDTTNPRPRVVLFDATAVTDSDTTAMAVVRERSERLEAGGIELWLAGLRGNVLDTAKRAPLWPTFVSGGRIHPTLEAAVAAFRARPRDSAGQSS
jgi:sulfate permease, SulP family